jgi:hypothetical protein
LRPRTREAARSRTSLPTQRDPQVPTGVEGDGPARNASTPVTAWGGQVIYKRPRSPSSRETMLAVTSTRGTTRR